MKRAQSPVSRYLKPEDDEFSIRIVIVVDFTGSMSSYLSSLRVTLPALFEKAQKLYEGRAKIEVIGYGDYDSSEVVKTCYGTQEEVTKFAASIPMSHGADEPEAVKTALNEMCSHINTSEAIPTVALLYTDAGPHTRNSGSSYGKKEEAALATHDPGFDWLAIARALQTTDVTFYSLLPGRCEPVVPYYACLGTVFLLSDTGSEAITDASMALLQRGMGGKYTGTSSFGPRCMVSFKEHNFGDDNEVSSTFRKWELVHEGFEATQRPEAGSREARRPAPATKKEKCEADKWRIVVVKGPRTVAELCAEKALPFTRGCGYYEVTRSENISASKGLVAVEEESGTVVVGGDESRAALRLGTGDIKVKPSAIPEGWTLYVQSTSYNRKLLGGTTALIYVGEDFTKDDEDEEGVSPVKPSPKKKAKKKKEDEEDEEEPKKKDKDGDKKTKAKKREAAKEEKPAAKKRKAKAETEDEDEEEEEEASPKKKAKKKKEDEDDDEEPKKAKKKTKAEDESATKAKKARGAAKEEKPAAKKRKRAETESDEEPESPSKKKKAVPGRKVVDAATPGRSASWKMVQASTSVDVMELCKSNGVKYTNGCCYWKLGMSKEKISATRNMVCFKDGASKPLTTDPEEVRELCGWGDGTINVTCRTVPAGKTVFIQCTAPSKRLRVGTKAALFY